MKREGVNENSRGGKKVVLLDSMSNEQVFILVYIYLFGCAGSLLRHVESSS